MRSGLLILLFVGIILMTANKATRKQGNDLQGENPTVKYKYLPRDLDTYIREDLTTPSLVHNAIFTEEDVIR
jgi:hypothetical protein